MEWIRNQKRLDVLLVGRCFADNENLGLSYLSTSLKTAGFHAAVTYINTVSDMIAAAERAMAGNPELVGISMADGGSTVPLLAFGDMLRRRGYKGHITCGGQFATLSREWLLSRYAWLDSVVRYAGEVPIVHLAKTLRERRSLQSGPGLTTRDGDGRAADVMNERPFTLMPHRGVLSSILKHRAAQITAGRGCAGRCGYCSPASLQMGEIREGRRDGISVAALRHTGVGSARRRHLDSVCDEMAQLYHERDVRYFYFVDEHMLPYAEDEALRYIDAFRQGLDTRGVNKMGIGTMLRADRLTPRIVDSFAGIGLVRAFIGLEFGDAQDAQRYGRRAPGESEIALISQLHDRGVATISNLMLVHPASRPDGIRNTLALLRNIPEGSVEISRMMVYHGTRLYRQLQREGNLTGNPIRYGYRTPAAETERFAHIADRLRAEVFFNHSIAHRSYDAALHAALGRRVYGNDVFHRSWSTISAVNRDIRKLYAAGYGDALELAIHGADETAVSRRLAALSAELMPLKERIDRIRDEMLEAGEGEWQWLQPFKTAAAAGVLSLVFTSACAEVGNVEQSDTETVTDAATDSETDIDSDTGSDTDSDTDAVCANANYPVEEAQAIGEAYRCFTGGIERQYSSRWNGYFVASSANGGSLQICDTSTKPQRIVNLEEEVAAMADSMEIPCPGMVHYMNVSGPDGLAQEDQLHNAVFNACDGIWGIGFVVELDESGVVKDVRARTDAGWLEPPGQEILDCLRTSLAGLSFPCLAETTLCSEYIIAE